MFKLERNFEKSIRNLKSPTSKDFDAKAWVNALNDNSSAGANAERLVKTALWIAEQFDAARICLATPGLDALDGKWRILLAIAIINREHRTMKSNFNSKIEKDENKWMILDNLDGMRVSDSAGNEFGVDELNESIVDAAESWIYDAILFPGKESPSGDLANIAIGGIRAYTWRKGMNSLWNSARHQGWYIENNGASVFFRTGNDYLERLIAACLHRQQLNMLNFPMIDRQSWPLLPPARRRQLGMARSVTEAVRRQGKIDLKIGQLPHLSRNLPAFVAAKGALEGSYLVDFLDAKMPVDERLTPMLVLRTLHVIRDSAEALEKITPLTTTLNEHEVMEQAFAIPRDQLKAVIQKSLHVDGGCAEALIEFLTYRPAGKNTKGHKGLWAAPLVPVPSSNLIALPLAALVTSNPLRQLEAWLERGGIDDSNAVTSRGDQFEVSYRKSICETIKKNPLFSEASCAEVEIKKTHSFPEQIDLLVKFGGLCLVGEVKFFLTPADPHECARYFGKLEEAAEQAVRKAIALDSRRDVVASALGIDEKAARALRLCPIVVTNQGFAFSMEIKGARVVDANFLNIYLSGDKMVDAMASSNDGSGFSSSTHSFYSNEEEAARQFDAEMRAPYVLIRHLDKVRFRSNIMPMPKGPPLKIIVPFVDDMSGQALAQAKALIAQVDSKPL